MERGAEERRWHSRCISDDESVDVRDGIVAVLSASDLNSGDVGSHGASTRLARRPRHSKVKWIFRNPGPQQQPAEEDEGRRKQTISGSNSSGRDSLTRSSVEKEEGEPVGVECDNGSSPC